MKPEIIYNYLTDDELLRISNKIRTVEKNTSGEVAVSIKEHRKISDRKKSLRDLAVKEFIQLGIKKTKEGTGVLIFLLLSERQFYILADENINKLVSENAWDEIKDSMQEKFLRGEFCKGIIFGIEEIGKILSKHFPIKPDDVNEIPNRVNVSN